MDILNQLFRNGQPICDDDHKIIVVMTSYKIWQWNSFIIIF